LHGAPLIDGGGAVRFADYAVSLLERKIAKNHIKSASGREKWGYALTHLIKGTKGVPGFGEFYMDQIRVGHIEQWQVGIGRLIQSDKYSPTTANGWIGILKVVLKAAKRDLPLASNPAEGIESFDTSEHETYTDEEPNALTAEEARSFLACLREQFPQHYGIVFLGFATGLRPSSLRPLRRKGETPDVQWDDGVILVRRSHTIGDEVMDTTKTGLRQRITAPPELIDVLRWHVETQLETPEQQASDLLFPKEDGGLRSESSLKKAFATVRTLIGLKKSISPRGMRRTFNDVARAAKVESLVTKSISGHLTDRMKDHYSTVSPGEQRESIGRVLRLVRSDAPLTSTESGAASGAEGGPSGAESKEGTG
jgi:integrase